MNRSGIAVQPQDVATLLSELEACFDKLAPGEILLREADVIDSYGTTEQRAEARAKDVEREWREVSPALVSAHLDAFPHLDPASFRFYLPALLRASLVMFGEPRNDAIDRAIYALAPGCDEALHSYMLERYAGLTAKQTALVRRFLEFATEHDDHCDALVATQALEQYWAKAAPPA